MPLKSVQVQLRRIGVICLTIKSTVINVPQKSASSPRRLFLEAISIVPLRASRRRLKVLSALNLGDKAEAGLPLVPDGVDTLQERVA